MTETDRIESVVEDVFQPYAAVLDLHRLLVLACDLYRLCRLPDDAVEDLRRGAET
jgi:hypothetical protein